MTDTSKCLRAYAVGDEDVINGSVENYDFDWGEPVTTPDCRCTECSGSGSGVQTQVFPQLQQFRQPQAPHPQLPWQPQRF